MEHIREVVSRGIQDPLVDDFRVIKPPAAEQSGEENNNHGENPRAKDTKTPNGECCILLY